MRNAEHRILKNKLSRLEKKRKLQPYDELHESIQQQLTRLSFANAPARATADSAQQEGVARANY